jgi:hypothetical protein
MTSTCNQCGLRRCVQTGINFSSFDEIDVVLCSIFRAGGGFRSITLDLKPHYAFSALDLLELIKINPRRMLQGIKVLSKKNRYYNAKVETIDAQGTAYDVHITNGPEMKKIQREYMRDISISSVEWIVVNVPGSIVTVVR